jgi:xylan 1,4-beta-xylosidase
MQSREGAFVVMVLGLCLGMGYVAVAGQGLPSTAPQRPVRYCNPLAVDSYPVTVRASGLPEPHPAVARDPRDKPVDFQSMADPTVLRHRGKYYLVPTGGLLWTSENLVDWEYHRVTLPEGRGVTAPHMVEYQGFLYLTGNATGLYRSKDPMGPWEYFGDFQDDTGKRFSPFDPMIFVDEDGRPYLYDSGGATAGIFGVELDSKDLRRFAGPRQHLFRFQSSHLWERCGDLNEYSELGWLEGPWMTKDRGTYYLQYSGCGTDWKSYAVGVYTSHKPLGPFTYAPNNPILVHRHGLINGTGHHCTVEGPDGNLWMIYTLLYRNWNRFERRIGLDPVGFDPQGNMFVKGPSETPQYVPGVKQDPWAGNDNGSIPVSIDKWIFARSSERPGRSATYAFDNNVRTWWEPTEDDAQPWLMLDLGTANPTDPVQEFTIDSVRILFSDAYLNVAEGVVPGPHPYTLEVSADAKDFKRVLDKTQNRKDHNIEFDEIEAVRCRYVRLTVTGRPNKVPVGILEFTVFGKPIESGSR